MTIYFGSDHRGFELKSKLIDYLGEKGGYKIVDLGALEYDENDDYTDYGIKVGQAVASDTGSLGIVICGTGVGISIAANKVKGIRCGLCTTAEVARLAKNDDNINVLAIDSTLHDNLDVAIKIVGAFITTKFDNSEKRLRRIEKITQFERKRHGENK